LHKKILTKIIVKHLNIKDMKIKILKYAALALLVAGSLASCAKKAETGGEVPFAPCPCEFDVEPEVIKGTAVLLVNPDWYPDQWCDRIVSVTDEYGERTYLFLNKSEPDAWQVMANVEICNFPDFAKEWYSPSPEERIDVYYEGFMYPWCEISTPGCRQLCYSLILTKLNKIK